MKALIQRVSSASVQDQTTGEELARIGPGLCLFLGVGQADSSEDAAWLAGKVARLRIFADQQGKMNLSVLDLAGSVLVVSQFTLYADTRRGNRPGFDQAAQPEKARQLYEEFIQQLEKLGVKVARGRFAASMLVELANDGPVTILLKTASEEVNKP